MFVLGFSVGVCVCCCCICDVIWYGLKMLDFCVSFLLSENELDIEYFLIT